MFGLSDRFTYMKKKVAPKIIDVAKRAGVSPATVSRVIRNSDLVKEETLQRVTTAMHELNYDFEEAFNKSQKKVKQLAVMVPDILDPFFSLSIKGLSDIARKHKYNIVLYNSDNSSDIEKENIELIISSQITGVIVVPTIVEETAYIRFNTNDIPFVFLDRYLKIENSSYVISDDKEGAYLATKYLLDFGHKQILYVGGDSRLSTEHNRLLGYKKALRDRSIEIDEKLIHECEFSSKIAYEETKKILEQRTDFSAAFGANDLIAFGIKKALEEKGLSIPDDISLIGYGDTPLSTYISLTTVSSPAYEMGKNAFLQLIDVVEDRVAEPHHVVLRPSVIFRSTCKQKTD